MNIRISIALVCILMSCSTTEKKEQKLTGINTLSYTDVTYISDRDTVIVSTFSGRISKCIKGVSGENIVTQLDDEIYSLAYTKERNEIIASTMSLGVVIIDASNGEIKKKLSSGNAWINEIYLSEDGQFLTGVNGEYKNFIWNVSNNYERVIYPENFPKGYVRLAKNGIIYHVTRNRELIELNPETMQFKTKGLKKGTLMDIDRNDKALVFDHNELKLISIIDTSTTITKKHPYWPLYVAKEDTIYRVSTHMKLSKGRIAKNIAFTGGIDRSVRLWDVNTGELKGEILKHRATISGIDISKEENQMVSVDLKGGIHFYDID